MNDYKSVQDLIVKAALYDGVSTTIRAYGAGDIPVLKITFSKGNRHSATHIELDDRFVDHEAMSLHCCKDALHKLLWGRYDAIKIEKEN